MEVRMDFNAVAAALKAFNIHTGSDRGKVMRATFYQPAIEEAVTRMRAMVRDQLRDDKVAFAIKNLSWAQGLFTAFETWIGPSIDDHFNLNPVSPYYLEALYNNMVRAVWSADPKNVKKNIEAFFQQLPRTQHALDTIVNHYIENIARACTRIIADWEMIERVFIVEQYAPPVRLLRLAAIEGTGSDFHKGGQQVLKLTFDVESNPAVDAQNTINLIYKPSDLELHCLIIGDSSAVNRAYGSFQQNSLVELINKKIQEQAGTELIPLPTYKILPLKPGSQREVAESANFPIREAYGYMEFLSHDAVYAPSAPRPKPRTPRSFGAGGSDYVISDQTKVGEICRHYYTLFGEIIALAFTFSIEDLHADNLIMHQYAPYIVDLEVSLVKGVDSITDTGLIMRGDNVSYSSLDGSQAPRLVHASGGVPTDIHVNSSVHYQGKKLECRDFLAIGCMMMMDLLIKISGSKLLDGWFDRINKTIARSIPIGTADHYRVLYQLIKGERPLASLFDDVENACDTLLQKCFNNWSYGYQSEPAFFVFSPNSLAFDYSNIDIPIFYHRIGTRSLMNSHGEVINAHDRPYVGADHFQQYVKFVHTQDYFAGGRSPTQVVIDNQYRSLTDKAGAFKRKEKLRKDLRNLLLDTVE